MSSSDALRKDIREELQLRVKGRYYGHTSPDTEERRVNVVKLYLILAGGDGCPSCEKAVEEYQAEIDSGDIEVIEAETSEKAMEIIQRLGLYALPAVVAEDEEGDYVMVDQTG